MLQYSILSLLQLPLKIDIIKHPNEKDGKSTAIHAAILAPAYVSIYTYPDIPNYDDEAGEGTVSVIRIKVDTLFARESAANWTFPPLFLSHFRY